jgi:hypothetical protein
MCGGVYYLCAAVYTVGVVAGIKGVAELLRIHDLICGHLMFIPLFVLAALQLPDKIQTWLLYHNALSEGVLIDTILKQARKNQQAEEAQASSDRRTDTASDPAMIEMRRMLEEQQQLINHLTRNLHAQSAHTSQTTSPSLAPIPVPRAPHTSSRGHVSSVSPQMGPMPPTLTSLIVTSEPSVPNQTTSGPSEVND